MTNGSKRASVTFDGTRYIILAGCWNAGIWRYVEDASAGILLPPKRAYGAGKTGFMAINPAGGEGGRLRIRASDFARQVELFGLSGRRLGAAGIGPQGWMGIGGLRLGAGPVLVVDGPGEAAAKH
jgi:hypothetical protein